MEGLKPDAIILYSGKYKLEKYQELQQMTFKDIDECVRYYEKVDRNFGFLKEVFEHEPEEKIKRAKEKIQSIGGDYASLLDRTFLNEAMTYLQIAIWTFLSYKYLAAQPYLAWAKTTRYFSNFYSINSLLRIQGSALLHLKRWEDTQKHPKFHIQRLLVERASKSHKYYLKNIRQNEHIFLWSEYFKQYKNWINYKNHGSLWGNERISEYISSERAEWNYDIKFVSKSFSSFGLRECEVLESENFLVKPVFSGPDHEEYWEEEGREERTSGDLIHTALDIITDMGKHSQYKTKYKLFLNNLLTDIDRMKSNKFTKKTLIEWVRENFATLNS